MHKSRKTPSKPSRQASQFRENQSSQARLRQTRRARRSPSPRQLSPISSRQAVPIDTSQFSPFISSRQASDVPIDTAPPYMFNRMLQYSAGIDYPEYILSANKFAMINGRRVPATWIQDHYADQPIELNFQQNHPLPLAEFRRRIEENEFRRKQLVNIPLSQHQVERFNYLWDAYLFWNPSKRPPNYQVPNEADRTFIDYDGPREITHEYQDPVLQQMHANHLENREFKLQQADLFWNPSKRPANYRLPKESAILTYDEIYNEPREITYEYQDPLNRRRHAAFLRRKRYLANLS